MHYRNYFSKIMGFCLIAFTGCLEPYAPPKASENIDILVVDGFINATEGSVKVRLSHSTSLAEGAASVHELHAVVSVRDDAGNAITLTPQDSGIYSAASLNIEPGLKYQLHIRTADSQEYFSDYVGITVTPVIDSISWRAADDGLNIYVNTHDDTRSSHYYRWDYVQTWEYHAPFFSSFKVVNKEVLNRENQDLVYTCWRTIPSTRIVIGNTDRLSADVISEFPIIFLAQGSSQISVKYSVIVQQRVLEKAEYEFWADLQRVTESLGGLFDSQPYQIFGNIHAADASVPVLGYFSGGTVQQERIFIDYRDLPVHLQKRPFHNCQYDTVCLVRDAYTMLPCSIDVPNLGLDALLVAPLLSGPTVWGYTMATYQCGDCRAQGGTLAKPSFWP